MDPTFSLGHRWWLQFQPDIHSEKQFLCEFLDTKKSDAIEDLKLKNITQCGYKATQNGCGHDKLCSPIPCTNPELGNCPAVKMCRPNQIEILQPPEVNEDKSSIKVKEGITRNDVRTDLIADTYQGDVCTKNKLMDSSGLENSVNHYLHSATTRSYDKGGITWRKADQRELASIVAIKSSEHLQNCDLPPPQSVWMGSGPLKGGEIYRETDISVVQDKGFITSLGRSPGVEEKASSLVLSGHSPFSSFVSEATDSPVVHKSSPADFQERMARCNDRTGCSDGNTEYLETDCTKKLDVLEALRRSQTRAREAEKTAALVILENEKLLSLCIREASHRNYYRQWMTLLEIENSKLKTQLKVLQSKDQGSLTCDSCKVLKKKKVVAKQDQRCLVDCQEKRLKKLKKSNSRKNGSWGLAVTLGLSIASATLILGLSMGLFFPSL